MIHTGDCIEVMRTLPEASVDAVVTDPPYGLEFMGKAWDQFRPAAADRWSGQGLTRKEGRAVGGRPSGVQSLGGATPSLTYSVNYKCHTCGRWERASPKANCVCVTPDWEPRPNVRNIGFQAWCTEWGREALRVTKPGGYLLAFGGTRTHHRLVCGLEDAGWIIRDELDWIYASGFPKGKANLKPAHEPIVLARKPGPLRALNIEESRIPGGREWAIHANGDVCGGEDCPVLDENGDHPNDYEPPTRRKRAVVNDTSAPFGKGYAMGGDGSPQGRWPSNLLLSDPELFDTANPYVVGSGAVTSSGSRTGEYDGSGSWSGPFGSVDRDLEGDAGGYSRFFVIPKSSRSDREPIITPEGHDKTKRFSTHPTQKPTDLMRHLIRLVTPTGGVVLDPFLGSGTTAIAAELEGFPWIGIEKEPEYVAIAEARLNGVQRGLGLDVPAPVAPRKTNDTAMIRLRDSIAEKGRKPHQIEGWGFQSGTPPEEAA